MGDLDASGSGIGGSTSGMQGQLLPPSNIHGTKNKARKGGASQFDRTQAS